MFHSALSIQLDSPHQIWLPLHTFLFNSTHNSKFISTVIVITNDPFQQRNLSSSSYWKLWDQYSATGEGRGGGGTAYNHFFSHEVYFGIYRHGGGFWLYCSSCKTSHVVSYFSRYYPVGDFGSPSFGVGDYSYKCRVSPRITHLSYYKVDCWIYYYDYVSYQSRHNPSISNLNKDRSSN